MQKPNWFDNDFGPNENDEIEKILAAVAKNPRVIKAVKDAVAERDAMIAKAKKEKHSWEGPSRLQTIRKALAEVVQLES